MVSKKLVLGVSFAAFSGALLLSCSSQNHEESNRDPASANNESPWTTWDKKPTELQGLLVLADLRKNLLKYNLHDPHVDYSGYRSVDCSKINTNYRSADGTCTDLQRPIVGAAGVAFGRNVPPEFIDRKAQENLMKPNPAEVSRVIFTREEFKPIPFLNMIAASWIQFMNHDWMTHGKNKVENPYDVPGAGDVRTVEQTADNPVPSKHYKKNFGKTTLNDVTHWWDGSQIYGSSQAEQNKVRSFRRGMMKMVEVRGRYLLPEDKSFDPRDNKQNQGREITGFRDNWWLGLSMLHHLFVKEHNAIAAQLIKSYVKYDNRKKVYVWDEGFLKKSKTFDEKGLDEHVFQLARLINSAVMAKIHTVEWTPAVLPNDTLRKAMFTNWYGLANPQTWSKVIKHFPGFSNTDWFPVKSGYVVGGVVGDKKNDYGVPFSITEEFTSVYRLHSLLPEEIHLKTVNNPKQIEQVPFAQTRSEKAYELMASHRFGDLFYSFGTQNPGQLVLNNFPKFMQEFEVAGHSKMDLGMVDIMRDRERGVPRYNQFRRGIGLKPIKSYLDFFPDGKISNAQQQKVFDNLTKLYGPNNVEMVDLLVGTLAEEVRPSNFGFGETMFQIFIVMASRRLMADRFYTDDYNAKVYTKAGIDWVDNEGVMAKVIVRHMPELAPKLKGVRTAFNPWNP